MVTVLLLSLLLAVVAGALLGLYPAQTTGLAPLLALFPRRFQHCRHPASGR
jgi:hypothetical protein